MDVIKKAVIREVIQITARIGTGTQENPVRDVCQYYLPNGVKIGEVDVNYLFNNSVAESAECSARIK